MPKRFFIFIVVAQSILTFLYWLAYNALLIFFPTLGIHSVGILIIFLVSSILFLFFSILGHSRDNFILSKGYILSTITISLAGYFLIASAPALLLYLMFPNLRNDLGILAITFSVLMTLYGLINARIIRVTSIEVKLKNLPEIWKDRTVVAVSDLHLGQVLRKGTARKVVNKINSLNPDIVFIPGDFYDGVHTDFDSLANEFKNIKASLGTFFSSGNHELFAGYKVCEMAIKNAGIKILEDEKIEIDGLQIIGLSYIGDPTTRNTDAEDDIKSRLTAINIDRKKPSILLKHVPNNLEVTEKVGIDFQISGHSHHGQVWPGRHITKKVWKGFDYGFKTLGNLKVYTSSGAGTWGPPLRVFTKSEIVKISFK